MGTEPYELKALRCIKCGAPLPEQLSKTDYIKCEFCGYTQKLIDIKGYLDKLRGEIYNWIKTMVPPSVVISQIIDPLARHNIFIFNIKPKIIGDFTSIKSKLATHLTYPLFILPFYKFSVLKLEEPKRCFENSVRIQSLEQMAIVDEDKSFLDDVIATYETYAYIINAFDLISSKSDLTFLIKNFEQATATLEKVPNRAIEYRRMHGVTEAYRALDAFLKGDASTAKQLVASAIKILEEARKEAGRLTTTAVMIPSIAIDISTLKALANLIEAELRFFEIGKPSIELLPYLQKYFEVAEKLRIEKGIDTKIYEELSIYIKEIIEAKTGAGYVKILPGNGNLLFPLWNVSVTYTFATGTLLWKKGKEGEDKLLVAGTAPLAVQSVTDVFGSVAGFWDRVRGKETALTTGFIGNIIMQASKSSIPSKIKAIPPLLTKGESELVANTYLDLVSQKLGGKIKFGVARAEELIYAVAEIKDNDIHISNLGSSQIKVAPYLQQLIEIAL
jgi:hypothetical protein